MGHRNPDRVPLRYRRERCETVFKMRRDGWGVLSQCQDCQLTMSVNLTQIIRLSGPDVSLWNKRGRCRRLGCRGAVIFLAKAPGMETHERLEAPD